MQSSWLVLSCYLLGSIFFLAGAVGFILSAYESDWLHPFQWGANTWIAGCGIYLIPPLTNLFIFGCEIASCQHTQHITCPWSLADFGFVGCLICFMVGCFLVGIPSKEDVVLQRLPATNALFLIGSLFLLLGPLHQLFASCCRSDSDSKKNEPVGSEPVRPLRTTAWWLDMSIAIPFVIAGIAGGYGLHPTHVTVGLFFWMVGSVQCFIQAFYFIATKQPTAQEEQEEQSEENGGEIV